MGVKKLAKTKGVTFYFFGSKSETLHISNTLLRKSSKSVASAALDMNETHCFCPVTILWFDLLSYSQNVYRVKGHFEGLKKLKTVNNMSLS